MADLKTNNTSYPTSVDTATVIANTTDEIVAAHINGPNSAIVAIENEIGIGLKGTQADLATRLSKNVHADGGILRGTSFPVSPPNSPHFFWRTDIEKFYVYDTTIANYMEISNAATLAAYLRKDINDTISAQLTISPPTTLPPLVLGANAIDQKVIGLNADKLDGMTTDATNTPSTVVVRDGSGNFAAGTITAALTGAVTGNVTGNVSGDSSNVTTNINGHAITSILESDGITAKQATFVGSAAGDLLVMSADTERSVYNLGAITKIKEITINFGGTFRIKVDSKDVSSSGGQTIRIYRNGSDTGYSDAIPNDNTYRTYSHDISGWSIGDKIQIYWINADTNPAHLLYVKNFRVYTMSLPTGTLSID